MEPTRNRSNLVLGALLVAFGALLFLGQVTGFGSWGNLWPFIIIGVGVAFFVGMALGGKQTGALAIPGSIITMVGLILWIQNLTNWWETWSYAWALIVVAVGIGMVVHGYWSDRPDQRSQGMQTIRTGLILFLVFGTLMEFIFSATGVSARGGKLLWPVLLTLVGIYLLASRLYRLLSRSDAVEKEQPDLFWPVLLCGIGALWTLAALNLMPALSLGAVLNLWPVLLIAAGLQLLFGRRSAWISAVLGVVVVVGLVFLALSGDRLGLTKNSAWYFIPGITITNNWPGGEKVAGSGNIGEETRSLSDFSEVTIALPAKVEIVQGDTPAAVISADDNLLAYISTEVRGNELVISAMRGYNLSLKAPVTIQLTVKELSELNQTAAADITIQELDTDDLSITNSGLGNIEALALQAESLKAIISGMGSIKVAGEVEIVEVRISGAGDFKSPDLRSQEAEVVISGAGQVILKVSDRLDANISGAGSVSYYGSPSVSKTISGAGSVNRLGD